MRITNVKVVSANVTADVELDAGEVASLGLQVDESTLLALTEAKAQAMLTAPQATQVSYLHDDPNTLGDVVDERTAHIEAHKQAHERAAIAKSDWENDKV